MRKNVKQYIELICHATGEKFFKEKKEYDRQLRNGATRFFKDNKTASKFLGSEKETSRKITKECPCCHKPFESSTNKRACVYCGPVCAAKHSYSIFAQDEDRNKLKKARISKSLICFREDVCKGIKQRPENKGWKCACSPEDLIRTCVICGKNFQAKCKSEIIKTCSKECFRKLSSQLSAANPNCGGENNYYRYHYNGIMFDSSWEVDIAKEMDEYGIQWIRSRKIVFKWTDEKGNRRRYYPDFYLPDYLLYLDPKNKYLIKRDDFKLNAVRQEHKINLVWGSKAEILDHIKSIANVA